MKKVSADCIAGFFDGEGYIISIILARETGPRGVGIYIGISNNNIKVLNIIQKTLGYGKVSFSSFCKGEEHNPNYSYDVYKKPDVKKFINMVKNKVIIKKEECVIALKILKLVEPFRAGRKQKTPDNVMIKVVELIIEMTKYKSGKNGPKRVKIEKLNKIKNQYKEE